MEPLRPITRCLVSSTWGAGGLRCVRIGLDDRRTGRASALRIAGRATDRGRAELEVLHDRHLAREGDVSLHALFDGRTGPRRGERIAIDLAVHEIRRADDQHALVVAHRRPALGVPCVGFALLLDDVLQLLGLLLLCLALGILARVADEAASTTRATAAATTTKAAATAATAAESTASTTGASAAAPAAALVLALGECSAEVEVGRVVKHRRFKQQVAHGVHAEFAGCCNREPRLGADLDEAVPKLPGACVLGSADLEEPLDHAHSRGIVDLQRDLELGIDPFGSTLARKARDHGHAEVLLDVLERGLGRGLVEVHRHVGVEERSEQASPARIVLGGLGLLVRNGSDAFGEPLGVRVGRHGKGRGGEDGGAEYGLAVHGLSGRRAGSCEGASRPSFEYTAALPSELWELDGFGHFGTLRSRSEGLQIPSRRPEAAARTGVPAGRVVWCRVPIRWARRISRS